MTYPARLAPWRPYIDEAASRYSVDPALVAAVVQAESNGDSRAVSPAGAQGLMQIMPGTFAFLGGGDPFDPTTNLDHGTHYLAQQLQGFGDTSLALAAFNSGPGAVRQAHGIPHFAETQRYVNRVLAYQAQIAPEYAQEEAPAGDTPIVETGGAVDVGTVADDGQADIDVASAGSDQGDGAQDVPSLFPPWLVVLTLIGGGVLAFGYRRRV